MFASQSSHAMPMSLQRLSYASCRLLQTVSPELRGAMPHGVPAASLLRLGPASCAMSVARHAVSKRGAGTPNALAGAAWLAPPDSLANLTHLAKAATAVQPGSGGDAVQHYLEMRSRAFPADVIGDQSPGPLGAASAVAHSFQVLAGRPRAPVALKAKQTVFDLIGASRGARHDFLAKQGCIRVV